MKAALPGIAAPNLALPGAAAPNQSCSGSSLAWSCACSLSLPLAQEREAASHPDSSWRSNLALDLGLCLFSICQLLVLLEFRAHILAGVRRCLGVCGTGPPPAVTCCRWIAPLPAAKKAVGLAKEHKASVPSGLLGIFSAKSPISPEQNPEVGRPGGGGGESCCSTAATPWCSVTGSCSPWHQDLCRKVLQASSVVRILFLLPRPLPLIPFSSYRTFLALYPLSILVASMQVPPRLPLSFLQGSDRLSACPLAFTTKGFFHLHTSPCTQFGLLPSLAAAKQQLVSMVSFLSTHAASSVTNPPQEVLWPV